MKLVIDGQTAWRFEATYPVEIEYEAYPLWTHTYREHIYFVTQDHYYSVHFYIPEYRKDGDFFNGYKQMIESMKILP